MASGVAITGIPAESAADCRTEVLQLLRDRGHPGSAAEAPRVRELLQRLEHLQPANLAADSDRLTGVWELRWSSGRLGSCVLMHALWNGLTFINLVILGS